MRIIPALVLVLIIAALGFWFFGQGGGPAPETATTTVSSTGNQPSPTTPSTGGTVKAWDMKGTGSLNLLLTQKLNAKCTVVAGQRSGTLYVSGTNARINFPTTWMIDDGTNLYVWSGTKGVKLSAALSASGSLAASKGGIDPAATLKYYCNKALISASLFSPPASVSFVDGAGNPI